MFHEARLGTTPALASLGVLSFGPLMGVCSEVDACEPPLLPQGRRQGV